MEITDIKSKLSLSNVLSYYNLKPDKNLRLCCPFHNDKTPSLQVYYKTHTAYCFSSNCKTHGKSMDIIDFVLHKENTNKHQALLKCAEIISYYEGKVEHQQKPIQVNPSATLTISKELLLQNMFTYFKNAVHNSKPAQDYIRSRNLDPVKLEIGYNTAQFHHGARRDEALINNCVAVGLLAPWGVNNRKPAEQAYKAFAKLCIVFALRNKANQVTGLYFRSTENNTDQRHYYLKDRSGLYPKYPEPGTTKLILTESIIDAATILQSPEITSRYSILSLYGTNGLTDEHLAAIKELPQLEEIILWLNADDAGNAATQKHAPALQTLHAHLRITCVHMPAGEDINSLGQTHSSDEIFLHLLNERKDFFLSTEKSIERKSEDAKLFIETNHTPETTTPPALQTITCSRLDATNPEQIHYNSDELLLTLLGGISLQNLDRLRVTIYLRRNPHINPAYSIRQTIDLYQDDLTEKFIRRAAEKLELPTTLISAALAGLTEAAEGWRLQKMELQKTEKPRQLELTPQQIKQAIKNLEQENLMQWTMDCYAKTGIIGELINAMILHVCMSGRKSEDPVSVICLSASGIGKSYLLERVAQCFPAADIIENTQMTENSFYYFKRDAIKGKIFLIEDMDGAMNVEYPIRELISKKRISKTVTLKDSKGNLRTITLTVEGPVTFCGCTTRENLYEDNANRCLLIYLDGSKEQDEKIMQYHRQLRAGLINKTAEQQLREQLQQMQCVLKPLAVINPYATLIALPAEVLRPRRTLSLLLSFIESITLYHQYQCERVQNSGGIITHPTHIEWAFKLLRDVLFRKSDELNAAQRGFLETLKGLLRVQQKKSFYGREIRKPLKLSPRTLSRYLYELQQYGYIKITGGNKYKRGYEYEIVPDLDNLQSSIDKQIATIIENVWKAYEKRSSSPLGDGGR
jgi:DNA primase